MTPKKLRDDAIIEAVCQVQFSAKNELPEVVVGRLSDFEAGQFASTRLPLSEMPPSMRRSDPNLRRQPLIELRHNKRPLTIRIGEGVISAHIVGANSYPGWSVYRLDVELVLTQLFSKVPSAHVEGLSLRYINAIVSSRHHLKSVQELELTISVGGQAFNGPVNLNFMEPRGTDFLVTTRVADLNFVQGQLPVSTVAVVDVEVSTPSGFKTPPHAEVPAWFEQAHTIEKEAFFRLIPKQALSKLIQE